MNLTDYIRWRQRQEEDWDLMVEGEQARILKEHGYLPSLEEAESSLKEQLQYAAWERQGEKHL